MKRVIFYFLGMLLLTTSCNEKINKDFAINEISNLETIVDTSCFNSQKINGDTYFFWSQSWVAAANMLSENSESTSPPYTSSPRYDFDAEDVKQLIGADSLTVPNTAGLMIYYVADEEDDHIPALALFKTIGCTPQLSAPEGSNAPLGLLASSDPDKVWIYPDGATGASIPPDAYKITDFNTAKTQWSTYCSSLEYPNVPVEAYNYSWTSIKNIISYNPHNINDPLLTIALGIKTISQDEVPLYYSDGSLFNEDNTSRIGLPVMVNMILDEWAGGDGSGAVRYDDFDFARPCPTYCNGDD
jgi:hypothetical protein